MLKQVKLILCLAIVIAVAMPFLACEPSGDGAATPAVKKSGDVIATVGDATITSSDFEEILKRIPPFNRKRYATKKGKMELLDKLIEEELFYQEAVRRGKNKDAEFVSRMDQIRRGILASMIKKELYDENVEVTEADMKKYFEKNPDKFQTPESVKVRLILIRIKRNADDAEIAKAEAKANEALAKLKAGTAWEKVVETYSEDRASKKKGGLLPKVRKGLRGDEFDKVAFSMTTAGSVSEVFKDKRGFNILKFDEKTDAKLKEYAEVEKTIERRLKQEKLKDKMDNTMTDLRSKAKVNVNEDTLDGIQVEAADAPEMPGMPQMGGKPAEGK
jgi:peptidyl-prolyl cis-trans isomerase C